MYQLVNDFIQSGRYASSNSRRAKKINGLKSASKGKAIGRPYKNIDGTLDGIWWILCTGSMWNQLPSHFGKWNSVWRAFSRWSKSGIWDKILKSISSRHADYSVAVMLDATHVKAHQDASKHPLTAEEQKLGKTKGGCNTKISAAVNVVGLPLSMKLVCGNEHDSISALNTIEGLIGGSLVLADKAYDTNKIRAYIQEHDGIAVIPPRVNRKAPIEYNAQFGKNRHRVENFFARIKRFRRISTRYDKLPETYMGFVSIAVLADWISFDFVHAA